MEGAIATNVFIDFVLDCSSQVWRGGVKLDTKCGNIETAKKTHTRQACKCIEYRIYIFGGLMGLQEVISR